MNGAESNATFVRKLPIQGVLVGRKISNKTTTKISDKCAVGLFERNVVHYIHILT